MTADVVAGDPYADWPARTPLYADDRPVLVFSLAESLRSGRPWADGAWRPSDVPPEIAADVVLSALAGYALSTSDEALVELLAAAGATEMRHAHTMSHALDRVPDVTPPAGLEVASMSRSELETSAHTLGAVNVSAYPPDHPDHEHADAASATRRLLAMASGEVLGPYLGVSTIARLDGDIVGACVVVDREGPTPHGGPWIVDVFRDPRAGVGRIGAALIVGSLMLARAAGLPSVGLAVTHSNARALELYRRLGFSETSGSWTLALPDAA